MSTHEGDIRDVMIARIQLGRSLKSVLRAGSKQRVYLTLTSEFRDPISNFISMYTFHIEFASISGRIQVPSLPIEYVGESLILEFQVPIAISIFDVTFDASLTDASRSSQLSLMIIPLSYENVSVVDSKSSEQGNACMQCRRFFRFSGDLLRMKEEYGLTMGSHIYDTAIVILFYLTSLNGRFMFETNIAFELGSGCGLVAVWLSKYFINVFASDVREQLQLLRENLADNCPAHNCTAIELNWYSSLHIDMARSVIGPDDIDLVIAGDVLYAKDSIGPFFTVLRAIASPYKTCVVLGQKLRDENEKNPRFDVTRLHDFKSSIVYESSGVVVWLMRYIPQMDVGTVIYTPEEPQLELSTIAVQEPMLIMTEMQVADCRTGQERLVPLELRASETTYKCGDS